MSKSVRATKRVGFFFTIFGSMVTICAITVGMQDPEGKLGVIAVLEADCLKWWRIVEWGTIMVILVMLVDLSIFQPPRFNPDALVRQLGVDDGDELRVPQDEGRSVSGSASASESSSRSKDRAMIRGAKTNLYVLGSSNTSSGLGFFREDEASDTQALRPYILFCVPNHAVSPHGAYLSHICRREFTGHRLFTKLKAEFNGLRGSTKWSRFWARFRVVGCQELKLVRVSGLDCLLALRQAEHQT